MYNGCNCLISTGILHPASCCLMLSQLPDLSPSHQPQFVFKTSCIILLHRNTSTKMLKHVDCHAAGIWTEIHLIEHPLRCWRQFIVFSVISCCQSCLGSPRSDTQPGCLEIKPRSGMTLLSKADVFHILLFTNIAIIQ